MLKTANYLLAITLCFCGTCFCESSTNPANSSSDIFKEINDQNRQEVAKLIKNTLHKVCPPSKRSGIGDWHVDNVSCISLPHNIKAWRFFIRRPHTTKLFHPPHTEGSAPQQEGYNPPILKIGYTPYKYMNNSVIWIIPLKENSDKFTNPSDIKKWLNTYTSKNRYYRQLIFLGLRDNCALYAYMPIFQAIKLAEALNLKDGDNFIDLAINGTMISDGDLNSTHWGCQNYLSKKGAELIPYLDDMVKNYFPQRQNIIYNLTSNDPKIVKWLIEQTSSKDKSVSRSAAECLVYKPRKNPAAVKFYMEILEEKNSRAGHIIEFRFLTHALKPAYLKSPTIANVS